MLTDLLKQRHIILASHSPRRRALLTECGIDYQIAADYQVEECYPQELATEEVPLYLSKLKSELYPCPLVATDILITADTVVVCDGRILGKPTDRNDAVKMLHTLSGRCHRVVTGVTLRSNDRLRSFAATTDVWFRDLDDEEIEYYVDRFAPLDKAGAYGIQEWIGYVGVSRIEGSFYNVMGLPVQRLYVELGEFVK